MKDRQRDSRDADSAGQAADVVQVPPDPYCRWVYVRRDKRTTEEVRRDRMEAARRAFRPEGSRFSQAWQQIRFELSIWWKC